MTRKSKDQTDLIASVYLAGNRFIWEWIDQN